MRPEVLMLILSGCKDDPSADMYPPLSLSAPPLQNMTSAYIEVR